MQEPAGEARAWIGNTLGLEQEVSEVAPSNGSVSNNRTRAGQEEEGQAQQRGIAALPLPLPLPRPQPAFKAGTTSPAPPQWLLPSRGLSMLHAQPAFALVLALVDKSQLVSLLPSPSPALYHQLAPHLRDWLSAQPRRILCRHFRHGVHPPVCGSRLLQPGSLCIPSCRHKRGIDKENVWPRCWAQAQQAGGAFLAGRRRLWTCERSSCSALYLRPHLAQGLPMLRWRPGCRLARPSKRDDRF